MQKESFYDLFIREINGITLEIAKPKMLDEPDYYAYVNPVSGKGTIMANHLHAATDLAKFCFKRARLQHNIGFTFNELNGRFMVFADSTTIGWFAANMEVPVEEINIDGPS